MEGKNRRGGAEIKRIAEEANAKLLEEREKVRLVGWKATGAKAKLISGSALSTSPTCTLVYSALLLHLRPSDMTQLW